MNPFAHFEDQFGHLKLSDNDAALHVFLAGWNSAMMEMMQRVNKMPFGDDTRASFAVYFQRQMVNVDAIEKPAQQSVKRVEPVAEARYDGTLHWFEPHGAGLHRFQGPLFTSPPPCPTCEALARTVMLDQTSHDAQRKPTDEMVVAAARVLSDRQAAACNVDCGDMWKLHGNDFIDDARAALEAANGITGEKK
jgi:hypothetical protein